MTSVSFTPSFGMAYRVNKNNLAEYFRNHPETAKQIIPEMEKAHEKLKDTKHVDVETFVAKDGSLKHRMVEKNYYLNDDFSVGKEKKIFAPVDCQYLSGLVRQAQDAECRNHQAYTDVSRQSEVLGKLDIIAGD